MASTALRYVKLKTKYAKAWHVLDTPVRKGEPYFQNTKCGYAVSLAKDRFVAALGKEQPLCQTCMLIEAHKKQHLHRV